MAYGNRPLNCVENARRHAEIVQRHTKSPSEHQLSQNGTRFFRNEDDLHTFGQTWPFDGHVRGDMILVGAR